MQKMSGTKKMGAGILMALALGSMTLAAPVTARAEGGLDMSTEYPGVSMKAGTSTSISLDFEAVQSYDVGLSVVSMPEGWDGYFRGDSGQISKVHVKGNSDNDGAATFALTIPDTAEGGVYSVVLRADAGNGVADDMELTIDLSEQVVAPSEFYADYPEQEGAAETSFTFDTTIANNKGTDQTYSLSAQAPGSGWQVSFTPSGESTKVASVEVGAGSSQVVEVNVTPPATITEGTYEIPCTVASADEKMSVTLKVTITGTYEVALSTPSGRVSFDAYANDREAVTLSITNNGNVDLENLNLTSASTPTGWEVEYSESTIELLEAGATKEVTAYVTPDEDSITGDYVLTLKVANDEVTSKAEFRVSVKTRTTWGFAALAIIAVMLGGLGFVFKKYGRR